MHAVSHSLTHRGPSASRSRPRWQPYSSIPSSSTARSPSAPYLNTPATTVSTPTSVSQLPLCEQERFKAPLSSTHTQTQKDQLRDVQQKVRYVNGLVDIAVKSLGEIWNPHDIPSVFSTPACPPTPAASSSTSIPYPNNSPIAHTLSTRYTQLPSPPVSPSHVSTPTPLPIAAPIPRLAYSADSGDQGIYNRSAAPPLKSFVHEVLRRSRTSCSVLQTALCYLEAVRSKVPEIVRQEKAGEGVRGEVDQTFRIIQEDDESAATAPMEDVNAEDLLTDHFLNPESYHSYIPPPTVRILDDNPLAVPVYATWVAPEPKPLAAIAKKSAPRAPSEALPALPPLPSPLLCPRRTFLASLILASKFTQDKCYSNRAWAKLAGLPAREIGRCERALGEALEWRLWVGKAPARRSPLVRSHSDADVLASGEQRLASFPTPGSTPGTSVFAPAPATTNGLRRHHTAPSHIYQQPESQELHVPTAPMHPAGLKVVATQGLWMPLPPPTPTNVEPQDIPMWTPGAAPTSSTSTVSDYSPTPTLSVSPASTDASEGLSEERTIQMNSFVDVPEPMKGAAEATYAYASGTGFGVMGEGGISQWDGPWTASSGVPWADVRY